jgi:hypothetical protein
VEAVTTPPRAPFISPIPDGHIEIPIRRDELQELIYGYHDEWPIDAEQDEWIGRLQARLDESRPS